uniref:Longin domain-containing protein n=1 Tax=Oryza punctata TaxID=4537 RepID=A0A0E0KK01_ORYPU
MVKLTMIARVTDGLPLAEGLDDGRDQKYADFYKQQAKLLFKNLSKGQHEASRMSIETGPYFFHYTIEGRVCYLTMCDHSYPKKLAFQYLEDLKNEFERVNGSQIETAARPYDFIKFDTFIQKTKKLYLDTRTQRNLAKLNDELYEVHQIMTRNVQEVLGVGEKVIEMSTRLTSDTRIYADKAKDLNCQFTIYGQLALIWKYAPVAIVIGVVLMLFWLKNKIWLNINTPYLLRFMSMDAEEDAAVAAAGSDSAGDISSSCCCCCRSWRRARVSWIRSRAAAATRFRPRRLPYVSSRRRCSSAARALARSSSASASASRARAAASCASAAASLLRSSAAADPGRRASASRLPSHIRPRRVGLGWVAAGGGGAVWWAPAWALESGWVEVVVDSFPHSNGLLVAYVLLTLSWASLSIIVTSRVACNPAVPK